jgi:four helix bundle protein
MSEEAAYTELIVWQKSMDLVDWVYEAMKAFPKEERFRLCDQLSRAVVSIPSNIAEGNGRSSRADYAHFLALARGSLYETMTQLEIAKRQRYLADYATAAELATSIRKMLNSMISKLTM